MSTIKRPVRVQDLAECGDGLGGWGIDDGRPSRFVCVADREDDAREIAHALNATTAAPRQTSEVDWRGKAITRKRELRRLNKAIETWHRVADLAVQREINVRAELRRLRAFNATAAHEDEFGPVDLSDVEPDDLGRIRRAAFGLPSIPPTEEMLRDAIFDQSAAPEAASKGGDCTDTPMAGQAPEGGSSVASPAGESDSAGEQLADPHRIGELELQDPREMAQWISEHMSDEWTKAMVEGFKAVHGRRGEKP